MERLHKESSPVAALSVFLMVSPAQLTVGLISQSMEVPDFSMAYQGIRDAAGLFIPSQAQDSRSDSCRRDLHQQILSMHATSQEEDNAGCCDFIAPGKLSGGGFWVLGSVSNQSANRDTHTNWRRGREGYRGIGNVPPR